MQERCSETQITLLCVEDDPVSRAVLFDAITVRFPEIAVISAVNGAEGLTLFQEKLPDIVVTDINMPILDGIGMAEKIRHINPATPIIAISAHNETHYLLDAIKIGINLYVLKPIDHLMLFKGIEDCIATILLRRQVKIQEERISKLSRAVERCASVVVITDAAGTIEYVNPKFSDLTGYEAAEAIGENPRILKSGLTPPEVYETLWRTITSGGEWRGELMNRKKGGDLYWESASISAIANEEGHITHFVAVKDDITERKKAEEEIFLLNETLSRQAAELKGANAELEAFNAMVSHDLKSPLANVYGLAQLVNELYSRTLDQQGRELLTELCAEAQRMNNLIKTLLDFSRLSHVPVVREPVRLSEMTEVLALELSIKDRSRKVDFEIAKSITVKGDTGLLRVVMQNLLQNAWKFSAPREDATIEFGAIPSETCITCFVRDNGIGFPPEESSRIFGPFCRLHSRSEFEGHGLGLATVQRIISRHGGEAWAEGEEGKGATFYFTLDAVCPP